MALSSMFKESIVDDRLFHAKQNKQVSPGTKSNYYLYTLHQNWFTTLVLSILNT